MYWSLCHQSFIYSCLAYSPLINNVFNNRLFTTNSMVAAARGHDHTFCTRPHFVVPGHIFYMATFVMHMATTHVFVHGHRICFVHCRKQCFVYGHMLCTWPLCLGTRPHIILCIATFVNLHMITTCVAPLFALVWQSVIVIRCSASVWWVVLSHWLSIL